MSSSSAAAQQSCPGRVDGNDDAVVYVGDGLGSAAHQAAQFLLVLACGAEYALQGEPQPMGVKFPGHDRAQPVAVGQRNDVPGAAFQRGGDVCSSTWLCTRSSGGGVPHWAMLAAAAARSASVSP